MKELKDLSKGQKRKIKRNGKEVEQVIQEKEVTKEGFIVIRVLEREV